MLSLTENIQKTERKHVVIISTASQGDALQYLKKIIIALNHCGYKITVLTNHKEEFSELKLNEFMLSSPTWWIPSSIAGYFETLLSIVSSIVMALSLFISPKTLPEMIICNTFPITLPILQLFGYKTVYLQHSFDNKQHSWIEATAMLFANHTVVINKQFQRQFLDWYPVRERRLSVVYPYVDNEETNCVSLEKISKNIPYNAKKFVCFGPYCSRSNFELAISAFKQLKIPEDSGKVCLIIAGTCDANCPTNQLYYKNLKTLKSHGIIILKIGSAKYRKSLVKHGTAVVHTGVDDVYGEIVLEAMSQSKPVLAILGSGVNNELLGKGGGFLLKPDPRVFSETMYRLADNDVLAEKVGRQGRHLYEVYCSFDVCVKSLRKLAKKVEKIESKKDKWD